MDFFSLFFSQNLQGYFHSHSHPFPSCLTLVPLSRPPSQLPYSKQDLLQIIFFFDIFTSTRMPQIFSYLLNRWLLAFLILTLRGTQNEEYEHSLFPHLWVPIPSSFEYWLSWGWGARVGGKWGLLEEKVVVVFFMIRINKVRHQVHVFWLLEPEKLIILMGLGRVVWYWLTSRCNKQMQSRIGMCAMWSKYSRNQGGWVCLGGGGIEVTHFRAIHMVLYVGILLYQLNYDLE